jgi:uncharacterized protein
MKIEDIHLIKRDINALFHCPTLTLIEVNELVYNILARIKNNENIDEIANENKIQTSDIETLINNLSKSLMNIQNKQINNFEEVKSREIGRITLHISNICNLRCKYCYANGGNYNQQEGLMNIETASKFIDFCTSHFDNIGNIIFFGGEPLLNPEIIEYVCKSFKELHKNKTNDYIPNFGIITNAQL